LAVYELSLCRRPPRAVICVLALLLSACDRRVEAATTPHNTMPASVACLGYLTLQQEAIREGRDHANPMALRGAYERWNDLAQRSFTESSISLMKSQAMDELSSASAREIGDEAANCVLRAPRY
jgi:hypothetical protein